MRRDLAEAVWRRAGGRCEYCKLNVELHPAPFQIDHIIAKQHGGQTSLENLALSCFHCNVHKGPNIAGIDPVTGELTRLFHPRLDRWDHHFAWNGAELMAVSAIGRVTSTFSESIFPISWICDRR